MSLTAEPGSLTEPKGHPLLARRRLLARLLKMPPPRCGVSVVRDIPVVMPDGIRLFSDHYAPRIAGESATILIRTPYGRGKEVFLGGGYALAELPAQRLAERGYHVIVQGVRGCYDSEGVFSPHAHEAADGQATVEWIARQPWFNGRLGTWGPSYLGYSQWAIAASGHPALQAMLVVAASAENFSVTHPDGAFGLETRLRWSQGVSLQQYIHHRPVCEKLVQRFSGRDARRLETAFAQLPLSEADIAAAGEPIPFYRNLLAHDQLGDPYWASRDHRDAVVGMAAPVHLMGGWYDYYLRSLLCDYASLRAAGCRPFLTIGPWSHAQPEGLMAGLREAPSWFDAHLRGDQARLRGKPVRIHVMGAGEWREMEDYPPPAFGTRFYPRSQARLSAEPPAAESAPDSYRYDPADPTPAVGGALLAFKGAGPQDNRALEARSDVLCYTTPPLARDLEIVGPVHLELFARSSLAHTDFFGRLCDVAPDGDSTNVCDGLRRVEPGGGQLAPDGHLRLEIDMWATAYRFRQGHRLRLQISSGAHPRWSRNLGTGEGISEGVAMAVAEQTILHDSAHPSALVLPVVTREGHG
jgi:putative CocE/NonD family hydrolase